MHAPIEPALRVETRRLTQLAALAEQWRALAQYALQANVFYEPEFALAAAPVFGHEVSVVLVWSADDRLLGFFPSRTDRWRYGVLGAQVGWTHPYAPLGLPLVDRDHAPRVVAAWLQHLAHDRNTPKLLLLPMLPEGAFAAALQEVLQRTGNRTASFDQRRRALLRPEAGRAGYLQQTISPKRRKEIRRLRRRLEEQGGIRHVTASNPDAVAGAVEEFLRLEASGWKGSAGTAAAQKPEIKNFLQDAVRSLAANRRARADLLLASDRPIAAMVTLFSGASGWCWKIAYDENFARYSPGVQLLLDLTQALLASDSLAETDSCAVPDHPMINPVWRERLVLSDLLIAVKPQTGVSFALACRAEAVRRGLLTVAKAVLHRLRG